MGYDVFISHSKNNENAISIYNYLVQNGVNCFLDLVSLKPGELFTKHISEARESCSVVVLLVSRTADDSTAVNSEVNDLYKKKKIIPVRVENFEPKNLMVFIGAIQWLDAYESHFETHLPKILSAIRGNISTLQQGYSTAEISEDTVDYLKNYFKELTLKYPSFDTQEERITIEEHSRRVLHLFNKYRIFNTYTFPDNVIDRDKFMIILALHDIGMAKVAKRDDLKLKYGFAQQSIKWLINQPGCQEKHAFNAQEEQIALALVSNEPIWRYLNNRFDEIACAEQVATMAVKAGMELDSAAFLYFFQLVMIQYLCDAGSYSNLTGGDRKYDFLSFNDSAQEINLIGAEKEKINNLEVVINKITNGAIPFTERVWKRIKEKYFNDYARSNISTMRRGDVLKGRYFQYRYNRKLSLYEICPRDGTKVPILYDPKY
ncbi:MAG: toll/interleukin-1 receptor domain-containing protein [Dehalococcoidia bacterium]